MRLQGFFLLFFLSLFTARNAFAEPQLEFSPPPQKITENQPFELLFTFDWAKSEGEYLFTLPVFNLQNLVLTRQGQSQETYVKNGSEWTRKSFVLEFKPLAPGLARIGAFSFTYIQPDTQITGQASHSEVDFVIKKSPRDGRTSIFLYLTFLFSVLIMAGLILKYRKRKKNRATIDTCPSYETRLDKFITSRASSAFPAQLSELTLVLREFLNQTYQMPASPMTEEELIHHLENLQLASDELANLRKCLKRLHEIKYLGEPVTQTQIDELTGDVKKLIANKRIVEIKADTTL